MEAQQNLFVKYKVVQTNILRSGYTSNGSVYQPVLTMDIGELIPADDSVRLLGAY